MLGSTHLNYLFEVASSKSNSSKGSSEIGEDLVKFGFIAVKDSALPGVKVTGFEISYVPLIFLRKADHKKDPSTNEIAAAIASGLGHVFEWIIHTIACSLPYDYVRGWTVSI